MRADAAPQPAPFGQGQIDRTLTEHFAERRWDQIDLAPQQLIWLKPNSEPLVRHPPPDQITTPLR